MSGTQDQAGIELQGAGLTIRGRVILSDLTLTLTEARIGIVGRNGSGKTSLLRLIAGLVAATAGSVQVDGVDPARDRKTMLSRLGILFQNPDHQILMPTVAEELTFGLRQMGRADAETVARAALSAEGRSHWADQPVSTLSHGQKQWLCLMSVLLMNPATILLDEPFAALDLPTEARLTRRLAALPQRLITISHAPAAVASCDRVIWLECGRVRADGPATPVLAEFTEAMARLGADDADADLSA
ncbi:MAG: cobalt ABC transporter [Rhodobacteraceae bacterium PARR1]|nr:MAG: cobalt ABC transporter [Rhodobacteraceae bacterium PARR1]